MSERAACVIMGLGCGVLIAGGDAMFGLGAWLAGLALDVWDWSRRRVAH